jgi:acetyl-CoA carboxylase biotin carboxyl carrier protein
MDLTQEDVLQILKIMDESDYGELHLRMGELRLDVNKNGHSGPVQGGQTLQAPVPVEVSEPVEKPVPSTPSDLRTGSARDTGTLDEAATEGLVPIKSPMMGTFYRSPKPGDPAFVKEGQVVDEETTVCIIEVMKLFSTIHAEMKGRIVKICADDSELVEYDQVLFLIEPETAQEEG